MAKSRRTEIGTRASRKRAGEAPGVLGARLRAARVRPATRSLGDVLAERGPLTGPITDAGTRALIAVRGEQSGGGHGRR